MLHTPKHQFSDLELEVFLSLELLVFIQLFTLLDGVNCILVNLIFLQTTNAEEYFDIHAAGVVTSDRTLSRLNLPQMDIQELRGMLQQVSEPHAKQQKKLWDKHCVLFRRWMFNMW